MVKSAYDLHNESLQKKYFSISAPREETYLIYLGVVPDLSNKRSSLYRFINLTADPIAVTDFTEMQLKGLFQTDIFNPRVAIPNLGTKLKKFIEATRESGSRRINNLVIPDELHLLLND